MHTENLESRKYFSSVFRVVGYLPDYEYSSVFTHLNWSQITQLNYFSVVPSATGTLPSTSTPSFNLSSGGYALSQITNTVNVAHSHGVKADIVLTGDNIPTIAASASLRATFVTNMANFCSAYNLDGVDIDWEPDSYTSSQITDFGNLIAALHTGAPTLDLSVAVNYANLSLLNTTAMTNLTTINVMTYDMSPSTNAPLGTSESYMQQWASQLSNIGLPASKLNYGLPFYGRAGTTWANSTAETYNDIVNGYIQQTGQAPAPSADALNVSFTNAFSDASTTWSFNGPTTIAAKTQFAINNDGGVMIWNLGQDHFNSQGQYDSYSLLPVINSVVHPPATQLAVIQQPTNAVLGTLIAPSVTIDVETAAGSVVTGDTSTVTLTISSGPAGASLGSSTTVAAVNGIATFANLVPTISGTYILSATDGSLTTATSSSFQVVSALPNWVTANSLATYNTSTHVLAVTGATAIIGDPGASLPIINAVGSAAQINISPTIATEIHLGGLNLSGGASVVLPKASPIPLILLLSANNISIDSSSTLDLGNNILDVASGDLVAVSNLVARGFNGGSWTGTGITSTAAALDTSHLSTLGTILNNNNTAIPIIGSIDSAPLSSTDVLVKYTYYGDADLSGAVDGSDYSKIDSGFLTQLTGWANGDFNYDGVIDGSDYTLIDNAFNSQRSPLVSPADLIARPKVNQIVTTAPPVLNNTDFFSRKKLSTSLIAGVMAEMRYTI